MFKNYLKIAIRNIIKHKAYSFINITGLAIGITCCLLISLYVLHELSCDRFHENTNQIYRIVSEMSRTGKIDKGSTVPAPFAPELLTEYPAIKNGVVKDFHFFSLHNKIEPLVLGVSSRWFQYISIKIAANNISNTMNFIKKAWQEFHSNQAFEYYFLDDYFDSLYRKEQSAMSDLTLVDGEFEIRMNAKVCVFICKKNLTAKVAPFGHSQSRRKERKENKGKTL